MAGEAQLSHPTSRNLEAFGLLVDLGAVTGFRATGVDGRIASGLGRWESMRALVNRIPDDTI